MNVIRQLRQANASYHRGLARLRNIQNHSPENTRAAASKAIEDLTQAHQDLLTLVSYMDDSRKARTEAVERLIDRVEGNEGEGHLEIIRERMRNPVPKPGGS